MKNIIYLSLFVMFTVVFSGLNSTFAQSLKEYQNILSVSKPIINSAVWSNLPKDLVYSNCITALHLQGYELEPDMLSKESGLIITKPVKYYPGFWRANLCAGEYFLNILVYVSDNRNTAINIQINGTKVFDYKLNAEGDYIKIEVDKGSKRHYGGFEQFEVFNGLTGKISEDVEKLLARLEAIQGKAASKTTVTLNW